MPSNHHTWEYDTHQHVTIDLGAQVVRWEDFRRGCEGGADQPIAEFITRGPLIVGVLSRRIQLEMLSVLSLDDAPWLEPASPLEG